MSGLEGKIEIDRNIITCRSDEEVEIYSSAYKRGEIQIDTTLIITEDVHSIQPGAFKNNQHLISVVFSQNHPMTINRNAFKNCYRLISVEFLQTSPIIIFGQAFMACGFESLTIPRTVTFDVLSSHGVFTGCRYLKTLTIKDGVACIPKEAFAYCRTLSTVVFPQNHPITLYEQAFSHCGFESLTIPSTVTLSKAYHPINSVFLECPLKYIYMDGESMKESFEYTFPGIIIRPTREWIAESKQHLQQHIPNVLDNLLGYLYEPTSDKKIENVSGGGVKNIFSKYHNNKIMYRKLL